MMLNNTPETMTEQQSYHQKRLKKDRSYWKENKKSLQKMACDWYKALSQEEEEKKEHGKNQYRNITNKIIKTIQKKYVWRRQTKKRKIAWKNAKNSI